jgi:hypothetical protein
MVKLLLGLEKAPTPFDASDALAVAICHLHSMPARRVRLKPDTTTAKAPADVVSGFSRTGQPARKLPRTWRQYRPSTAG